MSGCNILYKDQVVRTTVKKPSTLIEFLNEAYPDSPRTRIKKLLKSGAIKINDRPVTLHSWSLKSGDIVEISSHSGISAKSSLPFPVLYDDQNIIVIDKPAGISTSSTDGSRNIQEIVSMVLKTLSKGKERAHVVHRLDKEVSGVLLFAKSHEVMNIIKDNWDQAEKHYYALVEGIPEKEEDNIISWLIEDKSQKVHSTFERPEAKYSETHYKIIRRLNTYTLLDVNTKTGRKNQIRVHLSDIGCPIVGDRKYGASEDYMRQIRLYAYHLSFPHPLTGKMITIESPLPKSFLSLKEKDEHYK
jgi:23S rRNA pseudouridine1911/1915/1917 synthase